MSDQAVSPEAAPGTTPSSISHKRQRARSACLACRKRKRKCDTLYPCSMCTNYGYRCEYPKDESPAAPFVERHAQLPSSTVDQLVPVPDASRPEPVPLAVSPTSRTSPSAIMQIKSVVQPGSVASPEDRHVEKGILDPFKSRYVSQQSTVAFPRSLAADLQSTTPLPLHSYGWNCGVRAEERAIVHSELRDLITYEDFLQYGEVYWSTVAPIFSFLDREPFVRRAEAFFHSSQQDLSFATIVGSVVALGSFYTLNRGHARELDIVAWVKGVLEDPAIVRVPSVDRIIVWILRTVYLRATTRPHVSWLSSCLTMHLTEATGIQHEVQMLKLTTENGDSAHSITASPEGAERARKVFWLAWSLNKMISYEYGRSSVMISDISCQDVQHREGEHTKEFIDLARQLPIDGDGETPIARKQRLHDGIEQLKAISDDLEYICLTKADIVLCYYRRLRMLNLGIDKEAVASTIELGRNGVQAAHRLAIMQRPWWQVLGTVFQYICVLLAIDSSESLAEVRFSVDTLEQISLIINTHLAREALSTAKLLVRDAVKKKRNELELLDSGVGGMVTLPKEFEQNVEVNWDQFFDPTLSGTFWEVPDFQMGNAPF